MEFEFQLTHEMIIEALRGKTLVFNPLLDLDRGIRITLRPPENDNIIITKEEYYRLLRNQR